MPRPSRAVPGAVEGVHGDPAAAHPAERPVGQPEHRHAQDVLLAGRSGLRPHHRQPRLTRAVGLRHEGGRPDLHDTRQQRQDRDVVDEQPVAQRAAVHADEQRRGTTASRGRTTGSPRTASRRPRRPARAGTTRRRWSTCSSRTTGCTTSRTTSGFTEQNWNAQDFNFGQSEKWQQNDADRRRLSVRRARRPRVTTPT